MFSCGARHQVGKYLYILRRENTGLDFKQMCLVISYTLVDYRAGFAEFRRTSLFVCKDKHSLKHCLIARYIVIHVGKYIATTVLKELR